MQTVNLRKFYYPYYDEDVFVEVTDEVAEALLEGKRLENNQYSKIRYHRAFYSLDAEDGIKNAALNWEQPSPEEILLARLTLEQLKEALDHIPKIQARRVYAHYVLRLKKVDIARAEGVNNSNIGCSIRAGLKNLKKYYDKKKWTQ